MSKKWEVPKDLRFHTTEYVVDASHEESHQIWKEWHHIHGVEFEQDGMGYCEKIGRIDRRPIVVTVFWHIWCGLFRVAYVEGTSQLVDYKMINDWEKQVFRCLNEKEGSYRHSDSTNFGNVIGDMQRRLGRIIIRRPHDEVAEAIRAIPFRDMGPLK